MPRVHLPDDRTSHNFNSPAQRRNGAAAVEFVFVAPVLLTLILGAVDLGRGIMVLDLLSHAARTGARVGALPGNGNTDINSAVSSTLSSSGITGASDPTIDVMTAGTTSWTSPGDAGTAKTGDLIRVTVTISYSKVTWLAFNWFLGPSASLSSAVVISKE